MYCGTDLRHWRLIVQTVRILSFVECGLTTTTSSVFHIMFLELHGFITEPLTRHPTQGYVIWGYHVRGGWFVGDPHEEGTLNCEFRIVSPKDGALQHKLVEPPDPVACMPQDVPATMSNLHGCRPRAQAVPSRNNRVVCTCSMSTIQH
jgi:hypothetical protein